KFVRRQPDLARPRILDGLRRIARAAEREGDAGLRQRPGDHHLANLAAMASRDRLQRASEVGHSLAVLNGEARTVAPEIVAGELPLRTDPAGQEPERQAG